MNIKYITQDDLKSQWILEGLKAIGFDTSCNIFLLRKKTRDLCIISRYEIKKYNKNHIFSTADEYIDERYDILYEHFFGYIVKEKKAPY